MNKNWMPLAWLFVVTLTLGCGGSKTPVPEASGPATIDMGAASEMPSATASGSTSAGMSDPAIGADTPAGAVQTALKAVQAGKLHTAYDFFPASYQSDIDALIREFARKMDPEIWSEVFATLQKGTRVLKDKKSLLMQMIPQEDPQALEELSKNWDGLVSSIDTLFSSEIADIEKLKEASSRRFLETTGNKFFSDLKALSSITGPNPIDQLSQVQVEVVSVDGDTAVLKISSPDRPDGAEETTFVKQNGKWLPESLATTWEDSMVQAREQLAQISPEAIAAQKPALMQSLKVIGGAFDEMLKAEAPEELTGAAFPLLIVGSQLSNSLGGMFNQPSAPSDGVTIIVVGELEEDAQTKLLTDLEELSDKPEISVYSLSASGGETIITLKPVKDPLAFAEKLTFAKTKTVDLPNRTIRIELE